MLEFFAQYGPYIVSGIISAGALAGAIYNIRKCIKLGKKVDTTTIDMQKQMQISREAIVEAFKTAKLPNEIRLNIITKVEEILVQARDTIIETIKQNEAIRTTSNLLILKILKFTAASNKLTEDEQQQIEDILKLLSDEDTTIKI